ncbi:MAG TPA: DUF2520 domain-containing protein [Bacteroidales bacterium]|nr:DUF2520 domain-containing protein [Bacteroidales bacterium]
MSQYNISFVGAGRVADALCRKMYAAGFNIELIVSESKKNGPSLAGSCNALWSSDLKFPNSTDIIIVSVPDHRLKTVLDKITCCSETLVVHTAGSIGLDIFPDQLAHKGIFYPLQTFSLERKVNFQNLPFLLESSDEKSTSILKSIVHSVGGKVYLVDTKNRQALHLAAVFACNFSNHMLTLGKEIALNSDFAFDLLVPLINETISKAIDIGPENSQTGPAVRHDHDTIKRHLELLSFSPELQRIYDEMTGSIMNYYNKER